MVYFGSGLKKIKIKKQKNLLKEKEQKSTIFKIP